MRSVVAEWAIALYGDIAGHPERKQSLDALKARRDTRQGDSSILFVDFRNSALYSPIAYIPSAMGLAIGRLLRLPLLDAYYLGRLLNLTTAVALCYWTALRLPFGQLTFVMIALCPMFLFELASFSADAQTYALAAAFCGAVLRQTAVTGTALGRRDVIELSVLGALMGLTKPTSAPLPLFALLLLRRTRPWRDVALIIGVSWGAMLGWALMVSGMYIIANPAPGIDPAGQRMWIQAHPLRFAGIIWDSLVANWLPLYYSAVGVLGWLDTLLKLRYVRYFYGLLLVSGVVAVPRAARLGWTDRCLAALLVISTFLLVAVVSYLTWTPVGAKLIEGFQGRYFLPLIVVWVVLLQWPSWVQNTLGGRARLLIAIGCLAYVVFLLIHAFQVMHVRYWA